MPQKLRLVTDSFPERPAFDTAVSRAILLRVAAGELERTVRLAQPGAMVAFGRQDIASRGYPAAVRAARAAGFEAVQRLAGGRAAVFHEQTVAFAMAVAERDPAAGTRSRFEQAAAVIAAALAQLGVDARVGAVPGEYCPGEHSVNAGGRTKLAGIGQRLIKGAAHVGGVVVVAGGDRVRDVLVPVYAALGLDWDPATVGSIEDELAQTEARSVQQAIVEQLAGRYDLSEAPLDADTIALAERLAPNHLAPPFEQAGLAGVG